MIHKNIYLSLFFSSLGGNTSTLANAFSLHSSWGDEGSFGSNRDALPPPQEEGPDANGIKTVTSYRRNEKLGVIEKVVKTIKVTVLRREVPTAVEEREKQWVKFGMAKANNEGTSYPSIEDIRIEQVEQAQKSQLELLTESGNTSVVVCRRCGGQHWTLSCPFKDVKDMGGQGRAMSGEGANGTGAEGDKTANRGQVGALSSGGGGKYIPPSQRAGASGGTEDGKEREIPIEELTQLRISSLSPEADEEDLRSLFRQFGKVEKIFVAKDKITGEPRGFAFVRYERHDEAAAALNALNGFPYLHMILKIEWSKPDTRSRDGPPGGATHYTGYGRALAHTSDAAQKASFH